MAEAVDCRLHPGGGRFSPKTPDSNRHRGRFDMDSLRRSSERAQAQGAGQASGGAGSEQGARSSRERSELILADIVATRAERNPDFPVLTFECAGKPGRGAVLRGSPGPGEWPRQPS